jgi:hypothetical protein
VDFDRAPKYLIGRSMTEVQQVSMAWVQACRTANEIWIPSSHLLDAFVSAGVPADKLVVIPEAVDAALFAPEYFPASDALARLGHRTEYPWAELSPCHADDFIFISVFKWEMRKGWDVLLQAYFEEFMADAPTPPVGDNPSDPESEPTTPPPPPSPKVCLIIKSYLYGQYDPFNPVRLRRTVMDYAESKGYDISRLPRFAVIAKVRSMCTCVYH